VTKVDDVVPQCGDAEEFLDDARGIDQILYSLKQARDIEGAVRNFAYFC